MLEKKTKHILLPEDQNGGKNRSLGLCVIMSVGSIPEYHKTINLVYASKMCTLTNPSVLDKHLMLTHHDVQYHEMEESQRTKYFLNFSNTKSEIS